LYSVPESQLESVRKGPQILFAAEREILIGDGAGQHLIPIGAVDNTLDFGWAMTGRVQPANQAAHASARDVVNGNVVIIEPLEYSDMRKTLRSSTLECDSDFRPAAWLLQSITNGGEQYKKKKQMSVTGLLSSLVNLRNLRRKTAALLKERFIAEI
jgi:hypothetical protein